MLYGRDKIRNEHTNEWVRRIVTILIRDNNKSEMFTPVTPVHLIYLVGSNVSIILRPNLVFGLFRPWSLDTGLMEGFVKITVHSNKSFVLNLCFHSRVNQWTGRRRDDIDRETWNLGWVCTLSLPVVTRSRQTSTDVSFTSLLISLGPLYVCFFVPSHFSLSIRFSFCLPRVSVFFISVLFTLVLNLPVGPSRFHPEGLR